MRLTISSTFYNFTLLLLSLVFVLLCAVSGSGRVPRARVEGSLPSLHEAQNQTIRKSEPPTPDDSQVKTVLDKMAAAGIALPTTVADVRKAYLFLPEALRNSGERFSHSRSGGPRASGEYSPPRVYS